jgi:hypothetical protein
MRIGPLKRERGRRTLLRRRSLINKQVERALGFKPSQRTQECIQRAIDNEREAREKGELFYMG